MWCPGSGVVLDCIDSLSLPSFLLSYKLRFLTLNIQEMEVFFFLLPDQIKHMYVAVFLHIDYYAKASCFMSLPRS